jgi:hypothetical protein
MNFIFVSAEHWKTRGAFTRENPPVGISVAIPQFILQQNGMKSMNDMCVVATSNSATIQSQVVYLTDLGITDSFMDCFQPIIVAEQW